METTNQILLQILEAINQTNQRLDQTNQRLDQTNQRLDLTRTELSDRIDQTRTELSDRIDLTNKRLLTISERVEHLKNHNTSLLQTIHELSDELHTLQESINVLKNRYNDHLSQQFRHEIILDIKRRTELLEKRAAG